MWSAGEKIIFNISAPPPSPSMIYDQMIVSQQASFLINEINLRKSTVDWLNAHQQEACSSGSFPLLSHTNEEKLNQIREETMT